MDGNTTTYKPLFTATPKPAKPVYTLIWLDGDGSELDKLTYTEGEEAPATTKTPTKAEDEENTYAFAAWDEGTVDGNTTTYKPLFITMAKPVTYTATLSADQWRK